MARPLLPKLALRAPLDHPAAIRGALKIYEPADVAAAMLVMWAQDQKPDVRMAVRSADTGTPPGSDWVRRQIAKRDAYYRETVVPLLRQAGAKGPMGAEVARILREYAADDPTVTVV